MKALFDYQAFESQRIGGVSRSYAELISHFDKLAGCEARLGLKESDNVYLSECGLSNHIRPLHYTHNRLFKGNKLFKGQRTITRIILGWMGHGNDGYDINREFCIRLLKRQAFDVFEPTYFNDYFLPFLKDKPFVLTVHDMIPELYPQYFARDNFQIRMRQLLCPLASHIHVPSNKTKEDLVHILGIQPEKVTVISHGSPRIMENGNRQERLFDFPYLLYVGDRYGYKNFQPWIKEVSRIVRDYPDIHIVCTGKPFNEIERQLITDLNLENNIDYYFASQETFGSLYKNAIAFVFPSEYEGFGLPILEAFTYGCPVMLNDASCFPEVGGEAALYFSMKGRSSDFYEKFQYLYAMSSEERACLIEKGKKRAQQFSWDAAARKLERVYKSVI